MPEFAHFGLYSKQIGLIAAELYGQKRFRHFHFLDLSTLKYSGAMEGRGTFWSSLEANRSILWDRQTDRQTYPRTHSVTRCETVPVRRMG